MSGVCPAPGPDDPLVGSLLGLVDCNLQAVVQGAYGVLLRPGGAFSELLTIFLTLYVAMLGYRLLLGRSQLNISDSALAAVKIGAVVALATQWSVYETLLYRLLFYGPEEAGNLILRGLRANGSVLGGDVFDLLQRAFVDLTSFSPATPPGAPAIAGPAGPAPGALAANGLTAAGAGQLSTLLSKSGFDSLLLLSSAVVLLVSSLGVLLAAKIVLGLLLAVGPLFVGMLLFESTQGLFEGWLRACAAFAFAPLSVTLLLGLALTLLEPSLAQIEIMRQTGAYKPGVAFSVAVLVLVFAGVSMGLLVAGGMIAGGLRFQGRRAAPQTTEGAGRVGGPLERYVPSPPPQAARIASALVLRDRGEGAAPVRTRLQAAGGVVLSERRMEGSAAAERRWSETPADVRIGQQSRRSAAPPQGRSGSRRDR